MNYKTDLITIALNSILYIVGKLSKTTKVTYDPELKYGLDIQINTNKFGELVSNDIKSLSSTVISQ